LVITKTVNLIYAAVDDAVTALLDVRKLSDYHAVCGRGVYCAPAFAY
jgi:hypothetical protein